MLGGPASEPHTRTKVSWKDAHYSLKHALATAWACACLVVAVTNFWALDTEAASLAYLYFSPLSAPLLFLWLWACVIQHFEQEQISYEVPFGTTDRKYLLAHTHMFEVAAVFTMLGLTGFAAFVWTCAYHYYAVAQYIPSTMYILLVVCLMFPGNIMHRSTREFFCRTCFRVLLPFQEMTWADFLLADILTSLAKPLSDLERVSCSLASGGALKLLSTSRQHSDDHCGPLTWHALITLCLPYAIRFVQCVRVWATTGDTKQAFNALKYASAFPSLILSAVEHEYHIRGIPFDMTTLWLLAATFNSLFSYYWDVEQDWDMPWLLQAGGRVCWGVWLPLPKLDSLYRGAWYRWVLLSNLVLRQAWTHRLVGQLEAHNAVGVCVCLLEAFRRYQWVYGRYETELRKLKAKKGHSSEADLQLLQ